MRNKNRLNKLFTMLFASLLGIGLICGNTQASLISFADELTCVDEDGDGYCDICNRTMNNDVIIMTRAWAWASGHGSRHYTHTTLDCGKTTSTVERDTWDNCNNALNSGWVGPTYYTHNAGAKTCSTCGGSGTIRTGEKCPTCGGSGKHGTTCTRCGNINASHCSVKTAGHYTTHSHTESCRKIYYHSHSSSCYTDHYTNCTIGSCGSWYTGTAGSFGGVSLVKNREELKITNNFSNFSITSYSWVYNGQQIDTSDKINMTQVGTYTCNVGVKSAHNISSTQTLTYGVTVDSLANDVFTIKKTSKNDGYDLTLTPNPDYTSYYTIVGYEWVGSSNEQTWDILPPPSSGYDQTLFIQNCGRYVCTVSYKGNDGKILTKEITCVVDDFDAEIASHIAFASDFSHKYQYFSQQNDYTQAEEMCVTVKHGSNKIKDLSVRSFNGTTHKVNDTLNTVLSIKTYGTKSEVAVIDATFKITDLIKGTCTKEGTSTLVGKGTLKVGIRDDITGDIYYTGQVYTLDKDQVSKVGMNILNHDCPVKSYTWKDSDYNDNVSDYIIITRDCPSQNHNYEIWESLDGLHESHEDEHFDIKREITTHKTKGACQTVKTTVRYQTFGDEWVTYETTEERRHPYESSLISATCTEPAKYHYECPFCKFVYEEEAAPKLGHSYIWTIVKYMTAEEDGLMSGKCSRCGHETLKVMENPAKSKLAPRNVGADTDLPDIYIKSILDSTRATRPGIDLDLDGINGRNKGIALTAPSMGITSYGFSDSIGSNEAQYGIGYYEGRKSTLEKIKKTLEDLIKAILNGIKHIIGFFADHPVIAIILSIVIIAIIAALIYFFALRDRIKYKKADNNKQ